MKSLNNALRRIALAAVVAVVMIVAPAISKAATLVYDSFYTDVFAGNILVNSHSFKCLLVTNSYTPNKGTHAKRSDVTNEVTGTGYTAGGTSCTVSGAIDTTNHRYDITITGPSWSSSTITARGMVIYRNVGSSSTDLLVAYIDFGADITSTASTFSTSVSSPIRFQN